ncbi:hypothetical protein [Cryobacterium sp. Hh38]|uniref:hypothetical protein n=1 Tax=Cryobacterium sp. Hh38 TaxID=1259156 RepID=UPI0010690C97|nr:hypothetical protein [Cryobacterium sp. Hh38]TFD63127.1 hypothetical protein E3T41_05915 [Cryobacterium sp. Hh38]
MDIPESERRTDALLSSEYLEKLLSLDSNRLIGADRGRAQVFIVEGFSGAEGTAHRSQNEEEIYMTIPDEPNSAKDLAADGPGQPTNQSATHDTDSRSKNLNVKVIALIAVGVVVIAGATGLVFSLAQPSPVERAGEACSGSKPIQAFLDDIDSSASPAPEADSTDLEEDDAFAELFEGVVSVEDGGRTLIVNTKSQDEDALGMTSLSLDCVYEQLEIPKHITERIGVTRSVDGRQDGHWDEFTASWSYHPDNGANVIIVQD